jgi:hypothetical protein
LWTAFLGLLLLLLKGCVSKEGLVKPISNSDSLNGGLGVGDPSVSMDITCCQRIAQSSAQESNI